MRKIALSFTPEKVLLAGRIASGSLAVPGALSGNVGEFVIVETPAVDRWNLWAIYNDPNRPSLFNGLGEGDPVAVVGTLSSEGSRSLKGPVVADVVLALRSDGASYRS